MFLQILVTRSRLAMLLANNIRDCFVAIQPNFELLCRQWLRDNEPSAPNNRLPARRRHSVAGGMLFAVDGNVREIGNDFLPLPPRQQLVNRNLIAPNMNDEALYDDIFAQPVQPAAFLERDANMAGRVGVVGGGHVANEAIAQSVGNGDDITGDPVNPANPVVSVNSNQAAVEAEENQPMDMMEIHAPNISNGSNGNTNNGKKKD